MQSIIADQQIKMVIQIKAKTYIYRDNTQPLSDPVKFIWFKGSKHFSGIMLYKGGVRDHWVGLGVGLGIGWGLVGDLGTSMTGFI